jgi:probable HAF family extracellular repeat protein
VRQISSRDYFNGKKLNNLGQVAGSVYFGEPDVYGRRAYHACTWDEADGFRDLGPLNGLSTYATGINDTGVVVGNAVTDSGSGPGYNVAWNASEGMRDLALPGTWSGGDVSVNNTGQIAVTRSSRALLYDGVAVRNLGVLKNGTYSQARAVNDKAQVVGMASNGTDLRPFLWTPRTGMIDLGTLGGTWSNGATDINNAGQIIGLASTATNQQHGFLWDKGVMTDLGTLPGANESRAFAINIAGQVVGDSGGRGYIWQNGAMAALNDLLGNDSQQWSVLDARDINDSGVILAWAQVVPESATIWLLMIGSQIVLRRGHDANRIPSGVEHPLHKPRTCRLSNLSFWAAVASTCT